MHDRGQLAKDIAIYYGMVSLMADYIGRILDHLDAIGETDNTLIVFTSDHGHYYGHHGLVAKGPFHYYDGIRVPCIASWLGVIPENRETDAFLSLVDLPVTFLHADGCPVPPSMQGVDQTPGLRGETATARDHVLVEFRHQPTAIHMKTDVDDGHKLTLYFRRDFGELYDRHADPQELNNLWDDPVSHPLREELTRKLLFAEMAVEPLPMPRVSVA